MKVNTVTTYEISEEDKRLLNTPLPSNPCDICHMPGCCGCPEERGYKKTVKLYKDAGIYEVALKLKKIRENNKKIYDLKRENEKLEGEIPSEVMDILDASFF